MARAKVGGLVEAKDGEELGFLDVRAMMRRLLKGPQPAAHGYRGDPADNVTQKPRQHEGLGSRIRHGGSDKLPFLGGEFMLGGSSRTGRFKWGSEAVIEKRQHAALVLAVGHRETFIV